MRHADNDNERLTFSKLGLATALIVNRIRNAQAMRELTSEEKKEESPGENHKTGDKDERRNAEHEEYVAARLKSIASWERKLSGNKN